jgi:Domain of unknown function (DUF4384)
MSVMAKRRAQPCGARTPACRVDTRVDAWRPMASPGVATRHAGVRAPHLVWALVALIAIPCLAQERASRLEITLERKEGKAWKSVDPTLVLGTNDLVRFRFKSSFDGYLYVTNYGTSGKYALLFPRQETGSHNLVQGGKDYLVPATETAFRISGPPGYESVYWLVSPVALGNPMDLTTPRPPNYRPPLLLPRCDGTVMRARGLCLDSQAGPRAVDDKEKLPENLEPFRSTTSRELTIVQERNQSVVSAAGSVAAPLLYEFRLAHR